MSGSTCNFLFLSDSENFLGGRIRLVVYRHFVLIIGIPVASPALDQESSFSDQLLYVFCDALSLLLVINTSTLNYILHIGVAFDDFGCLGLFLLAHLGCFLKATVAIVREGLSPNKTL